MKKNEITQLKNSQKPELEKKLVESYEKLRNLKFDLMQGKIKNIKEIKETKKLIARIITILNK